MLQHYWRDIVRPHVLGDLSLFNCSPGLLRGDDNGRVGVLFRILCKSLLNSFVGLVVAPGVY